MSTKVIEIDGKEIVCTYTGATARIYRNKFHSDLLLDLNRTQAEFIKRLSEFASAEMELKDIEVTALLIETIGTEMLEKITWCTVATTNKLKKGNYVDYDRFIDSIEDYPSFIGWAVGVYELLVYGNETIVEPDKDETKKKVTTEEMTLQA